LMKERPEEALRRPLQFSTAIMEEKRENEGFISNIGCYHNIVESVS